MDGTERTTKKMTSGRVFLDSRRKTIWAEHSNLGSGEAVEATSGVVADEAADDEDGRLMT